MALLLAVLSAGAHPVLAQSLMAKSPGEARIVSPASYPGAPQRIPAAAKPPYAMTYGDEAAAKLGFRDGRMDFFSTRRDQPLVPVLSGGVGSDGAMLRLRWQPGG